MVPSPKVTNGEAIEPALSVPPKAPTFNVAVEPASNPIVILVATKLPPLATITVPPPEEPIVAPALLLKVEPAPEIRTLLFVAVELLPTIVVVLAVIPPLLTVKELPML